MRDYDYTVRLDQTDDSVWITVGGKIKIRVMQTDEGAACDMYDATIIADDMDEAHRAACYTFFNEILGEGESESDSTAEAVILRWWDHEWSRPDSQKFNSEREAIEYSRSDIMVGATSVTIEDAPTDKK